MLFVNFLFVILSLTKDKRQIKSLGGYNLKITSPKTLLPEFPRCVQPFVRLRVTERGNSVNYFLPKKNNKTIPKLFNIPANAFCKLLFVILSLTKDIRQIKSLVEHSVNSSYGQIYCLYDSM